MKSQNNSGQATGVGTVQGNLNVYNSPIVSRPGTIARLVSKICDHVAHEPIDSSKDYTQYEIDNKLDHNNVIEYRWLIEEYGEYCYMIDNAYNAVSEENPLAKDKTLKFIKRTYKQKLGKVLREYGSEDKSDIEIIREYSDIIIELVITDLEELLLNSENCPDDDIEQLKTAIKNISGHAFVECSILEKPD